MSEIDPISPAPAPAAAPSNPNLEKALALVALGFWVFPCYHTDTVVGDKLHQRKWPKTKQGHLNASVWPEHAIEHWSAHPDDLVGVWTGKSGIVVLDIDINSDKGKDGQFSIDEAELEVTDSYNYKTHSGGWHYVYKAPAGDELRPKKDYVLPDGTVLTDVDRRSGSSYVIWWGAPPLSREQFAETPEWFTHDTPSGSMSPYEGLVEEWYEKLPAERPEPDELVQMMVDRIILLGAKDFGHDDMRNMQRALIGFGADRKPGVREALDLLRDTWLRGKYDTPENARDWETSLAGGIAKYGGGRTEGELDFWHSRPLLEHIYVSSRSLLTDPWHTLAGLMTRALHLTPYPVVYQSVKKGSLNMIVAVAGDTGTGKSSINGLINEYYDFKSGDQGLIFEMIEPGSGEAIPDTYARKLTEQELKEEITEDPETGQMLVEAATVGDFAEDGLHWFDKNHAAMFAFDEIGRLMKMNARPGGSTVIEFFKTGYSGGSLGRTLSQRNGFMLPSMSYRMTATLNVQPTRGEVLLNEDELAGGFPGRLLWVSSQDPTLLDEAKDDPVEPYEIELPDWKIRANVMGRPMEKYVQIFALPQMLRYHRELSLRGHGGDLDPNESHGAMTRVKVAIALMILDNRKELIDEDWDLSAQVMAKSDAVRKHVQSEMAKAKEAEMRAAGAAQGKKEYAAQESKGRAAIDAQKKKILAAQKHAVEKGIPFNHKDLYRNNTRPDHRDAFCDAVIELGLDPIKRRVKSVEADLDDEG